MTVYNNQPYVGGAFTALTAFPRGAAAFSAAPTALVTGADTGVGKGSGAGGSGTGSPGVGVGCGLDLTPDMIRTTSGSLRCVV